MTGGRPTVAVIGGGIAGLAAAWELSREAVHVVVLESSERLGGKLRTVPLGDRSVDAGPDGFLGRRPEAVALCREIGLGDELVPIGTSGAAVWARSRRRALPASLALGIPTRFLPVARSGILGPVGNLRLLVDVVAPRRDRRGPLGDRAIGPLVAHRLGRQVVEKLVDPMVGGIHAGGVADMSAAGAYPLLLAVSQRRTGLMRALRQAGQTGARPVGGPPEPAFWTLRGGIGSLPGRLGEVLAARGVDVRTSVPVELVDRGEGPRWVLHTAEGPVVADGVVIAVPATPAASLLAPHDPDAAALLGGIDHASVGMVTVELPDDAVPPDLYGTGLLVPRNSAVPGRTDGETFLVTACSYLTAKWPHLARPGTVVVRASVGRFGDDRATALTDRDLVDRVMSELGVLLDVRGQPVAAAVTRWPGSLPQYRVHHLLRVTGIEAAVSRLHGVAVAGSAYRGVGIPACIASGRAAARTVMAAVAGMPKAGGSSP
jgi:oxygen-dependent protoporphyrinogen oxidase